MQFLARAEGAEGVVVGIRERETKVMPQQFHFTHPRRALLLPFARLRLIVELGRLLEIIHLAPESTIFALPHQQLRLGALVPAVSAVAELEGLALSATLSALLELGASVLCEREGVRV